MQIKSELIGTDLKRCISDALEIDVQLTAGVYQQYGVICETINNLRPVLQTMTLSEVCPGLPLLNTLLTTFSERSRTPFRASSSTSNQRNTRCYRSRREFLRQAARHHRRALADSRRGRRYLSDSPGVV